MKFCGRTRGDGETCYAPLREGNNCRVCALLSPDHVSRFLAQALDLTAEENGQRQTARSMATVEWHHREDAANAWTLTVTQQEMTWISPVLTSDKPGLLVSALARLNIHARINAALRVFDVTVGADDDTMLMRGALEEISRRRHLEATRAPITETYFRETITFFSNTQIPILRPSYDVDGRPYALVRDRNPFLSRAYVDRLEAARDIDVGALVDMRGIRDADALLDAAIRGPLREGFVIDRDQLDMFRNESDRNIANLWPSSLGPHVGYEIPPGFDGTFLGRPFIVLDRQVSPTMRIRDPADYTGERTIAVAPRGRQ